MKTLFKTLVLFLLAFPAICFSEPKRKDFPAIVRIKVESKGGSKGTGFFIGPKKLATDLHVISKASHIEDISFQDPLGRWHPVKAILALDAINDLAVLDVGAYKSGRYYSLDHSLDSVQEVETAGFPSSKFQHTHGQVLPSKLKDENLYILLPKSAGDGASGSPIFKDDKLIAVQKQGGSNISIATPASSLKALLSKPLLNCKTGFCIENEIKRVQQLAEKGDRIAQYNLAVMYYHGISVEQNFNKAFYWAKKAAELGHPGAQFMLAQMYNKGKGIKQNSRKAFELYTLATKQGYVLAQLNLANRYYEGTGIEQNFKKAFELYIPLAKLGLPEAQLMLAQMYDHGQSVEQNVNKAFYWLMEAAKQGHPTAQFNLAIIYYHGQGVEQNLKLAGYWAEKALEQGIPEAKVLLIKIKNNSLKTTLRDPPSSCRDVFQKQSI